MKSILAIIGLVITVASTTFAISASTAVAAVKESDKEQNEKIRLLEIDKAKIDTKLDGLQKSVDHVVELLEKHVDKGSK